MDGLNILERFFETYGAPRVRALCAYSGGEDSTLLLELLHLWCRDPGRAFDLTAVYVQHGIRPGAQEREVDHCGRFCADRGIPFVVVRGEALVEARKGKCSLELAARRLRRRLLLETARRLDADSIFVGHHAGDQLETRLFRIFRGTGIFGMQGMRPVHHEGGIRWLRPLLELPKQELSHAAAAAALHFVEDASNKDPGFTRNRIRQELIPMLENIFGRQFPDSLTRLTRLCGETLQVLETAWKESLSEAVWPRGSGVWLDLALLKSVPDVLVPETLRSCLRQVHPSADLFNHKHCLALLRLREARVGSFLNLGGGWSARRDRGWILVWRGHLEEALPRYVTGISALAGEGPDLGGKCGGDRFRNWIRGLEDRLCFALNPDLDPASLFWLRGLGGVRHAAINPSLNGRPLKKIFSEYKAPLALTESLPILCRDDEILLVPGMAQKEGAFGRWGRLVEVHVNPSSGARVKETAPNR